MDRLNDNKINQYITDFTQEQTKLFSELKEAPTLEQEGPIKKKLDSVNSMVKHLYDFRTILRKEKEKEI